MTCNLCGRLSTTDRHQCPPKWFVWDPARERETGRIIHAENPPTAVETWAAGVNGELYDFAIGIGSVHVVVMVQSEANKVTRWIVTGETVPVFRARLVT